MNKSLTILQQITNPNNISTLNKSQITFTVYPLQIVKTYISDI